MSDDLANLWMSTFETGAILNKIGYRGSGFRKVVKTEGKTQIIVNTIDEEIRPTIPSELSSMPEDKCLWTSQCWPGHFKVWARLDKMETELGRWLYFEAKIPVKLLWYPNSKSFLAFERTACLAFSLGTALNRKHGKAIKGVLLALLNPDTRWDDGYPSSIIYD